jgi:C1A family cysteine protease
LARAAVGNQTDKDDAMPGEVTLKRGYGWVRDLPDHRDHLYAAPIAPTAIPPKADLRAGCPPVYDQGQLGSCTANAIAAAIDFERRKQGLDIIAPSRLFIYYNERVKEHTVNSDSGAQIRDGIKVVGTEGAPPEALWPYDTSKFEIRPPDACYAKAKLDRALQYSRVPQVLSQMKGCIASGYPYVFGFTVYESFESAQVAKSGDAPMPAPGEQVLGGHAVMAVGYDDGAQRFIIRNSWGVGWGIEGYFTLPYAYLTDGALSSDFWTLRLVGAAAGKLTA